MARGYLSARLLCNMQFQIVTIQSRSVYFLRRVRPDVALIHASSSPASEFKTFSNISLPTDRFFDFLIACATANITSDSFLNISNRRVVIYIY